MESHYRVSPRIIFYLTDVVFGEEGDSNWHPGVAKDCSWNESLQAN